MNKGYFPVIRTLLSFVLAVVIAGAQQSSDAKATNHQTGSSSELPSVKSAASAVKPEDPVITISGICEGNLAKAASSSGCTTKITRDQFEKLITALGTSGQPVPAEGRQQLAQTWVDLLAYQKAASASGMESSPEFKALMELIRLRTLSEIYRRNLQAKYRTPSAQDIDDYYSQNPTNFTSIKLSRILIPRKNPAAANREEYEKRALQVANDLQDRAAKGEDFSRLQKEGYDTLGLISPPATDLGIRRKASLLTEEQDEVFSMSEGGVSKVEQEPYSFVIYKIESKRLLSKEEVKDEISREISKQRLEKAYKEITSAVHSEFNQEYFAPPPPGNPTVTSPALLQSSSQAH
jgi:PPIC-type PPIASE domain